MDVWRGASDTVGVVLLVAVCVGVSAAVGVAVLEISESSNDTGEMVGVRAMADSVQVVSGSADSISIFVEGVEVKTIQTPSVGQLMMVNASFGDAVRVQAVVDGSERVVLQQRAEGGKLTEGGESAEVTEASSAAGATTAIENFSDNDVAEWDNSSSGISVTDDEIYGSHSGRHTGNSSFDVGVSGTKNVSIFVTVHPHENKSVTRVIMEDGSGNGPGMVLKETSDGSLTMHIGNSDENKTTPVPVQAGETYELVMTGTGSDSWQTTVYTSEGERLGREVTSTSDARHRDLHVHARRGPRIETDLLRKE